MGEGLWENARLEKVTRGGSYMTGLVVLKGKPRWETACVLSCRWYLCRVLKLLPDAGSMILDFPDSRTEEDN